MTEPKLFTEREWAERLESCGCFEWRKVIEELRERGLIAPEPVDPLLIEAREICARVVEGFRDLNVRRAAKFYREGVHDDEPEIAFIYARLTALTGGDA